MKKQLPLLILTFFLWGSIYVVSKYAYTYISPLAVLAMRYFVASLTLLPFALKSGLQKIRKEHIKYFIFIGAVGYAISVAFTSYSTKLMDASMSSLINSLSPVTITIAAAVFLKEKINKFVAGGIVLSLVGVFIVLGVANGATVPGMILSILGLSLWSILCVFIRKISSFYSPQQITFTSMAIALPVCAVAAIAEGIILHQAPILNLSSVGSILYIGSLCTAIANLLWSASLKKIEASVCSAFYPLQPLSSAILGVIILGEKVTWGLVAGGLLIAAGVVTSLLGQQIWNRIRKPR